MSLTPDDLTKRYYRALGYRVIKVEHWKMYPKLRRADFLGIYDFIAMNDEETLAVQTTTKGHHSDRRTKMLKSQSFAWWTKPKAKRFSVLLTWYKESGEWQPKKEELTMEDWERFQAAEREKFSQVDTTTELYKLLFPEGHTPPDRPDDSDMYTDDEREEKENDQDHPPS